MSKIAETNEKIAEKVVDGYKKIETGVVEGYKKIENGVVEGFEKVSDKCVEVLFAKEGESVEDAKKRLSGAKDTTNKKRSRCKAAPFLIETLFFKSFYAVMRHPLKNAEKHGIIDHTKKCF